MKLTVLTDNNTYIDQYFLGEPAVCYLLEDGGEKLFFDLGYSDVYLKNAKSMGLDLGMVHTLVFSHGHNDHTGGLACLPPELVGCRIVGHPNLLEPKRGGGLSISAPVQAEELSGTMRLCLSREPQRLSEHVWFLGEIPRCFSFENQKPVGLRYVRGQWEPDYVLDDSALALLVSDGVFVVTGCSHAGICNIIRYAKEVTGRSHVLGVIGGFHL
ncbi:MAG: MBL fold metallo-hydrolase, partial [Clostridia bacterium]|nr:MBL fold metallo-hydrolase [Clostridia bacterium]